jgi:undecaprenyl-diphosphatase
VQAEVVVAAALGALQGAVEWLPVSSEGFVAVAVSALGAEPSVAVRLALFLHLGTALAATAFYREDLRALSSVDDGTLAADRRFLIVATLVSGVVGIGAYLALEAVVSELAGGTFLALVGALLVGTGLFLRATSERRLADGGHAEATDGQWAGDAEWIPSGDRERPDLAGAALVGVCQGVAVLPGISRSGTTVGALLLRGHDGPRSLQLSFLLSIPAAVGAAGIAVADGGLPAVAPAEAVVAVGVAAVAGDGTVDLLTRLVRRVAFWVVCVGLGALAVLGGLGAAP